MDVVLEVFIRQMVPISMDSFGVWIPLAFGLGIGLVYAIVSGLRRQR